MNGNLGLFGGFLVGFLLMFTPFSALSILDGGEWGLQEIVVDVMRLVGLVAAVYFGFKVMKSEWKSSR
ncbi:hypothetical protein SY83_15265 [Paenibacillus swuensis]|uniref:Uncharacterized protein n=1 Tax=Paenibacillus swuensis TaxID=1178515 RepID=A0A172TK50_9BACL|nr:hypothetical protein [Paenibacillus swuensis]ANE47408.1 hypothetical protein SY83_15265 [Paenibacillus swuensis]